VVAGAAWAEAGVDEECCVGTPEDGAVA